MAEVSFWGVERRAALMFIFQIGIPLTGGALLFSRGMKKRWSLSSDLIIQSVDWPLSFSSGKAKHCEGIQRAGLPQSAISLQCCGATKCVYQLPISISRDITHRGVNVWTKWAGMKMITGSHKGLFHLGSAFVETARIIAFDWRGTFPACASGCVAKLKSIPTQWQPRLSRKAIRAR